MDAKGGCGRAAWICCPRALFRIPAFIATLNVGRIADQNFALTVIGPASHLIEILNLLSHSHTHPIPSDSRGSGQGVTPFAQIGSLRPQVGCHRLCEKDDQCWT